MSSPNLELQTHPEINTVRRDCERLNEALTELILQRDYLQRTVLPSIAAEYALKIGHLEYRVFWTDCELRALKRRIELAQAMLNRGDASCYECVEKQINQEFARWREQIADRREIKRAKEFAEAPKISGADSKRLHALYRNLAKRLHPDLNETTVRREKLWQQTSEAYQTGDLPALETLWLIVENNVELNGEINEINSSHTLAAWQQKKARLLTIVEQINDEIADLRRQTPHLWQNILSDERAVTNRQNELQRELFALQTRRLDLTKLWATVMQSASALIRISDFTTSRITVARLWRSI